MVAGELPGLLPGPDAQGLGSGASPRAASRGRPELTCPALGRRSPRSSSNSWRSTVAASRSLLLFSLATPAAATEATGALGPPGRREGRKPLPLQRGLPPPALPQPPQPGTHLPQTSRRRRRRWRPPVFSACLGVPAGILGALRHPQPGRRRLAGAAGLEATRGPGKSPAWGRPAGGQTLLPPSGGGRR